MPQDVLCYLWRDCLGGGVEKEFNHQMGVGYMPQALTDYVLKACYSARIFNNISAYICTQ